MILIPFNDLHPALSSGNDNARPAIAHTLFDDATQQGWEAAKTHYKPSRY